MNDTESLWDDAQEAYRWRPLMPLLKKARETPPSPEKLAASRDAAAFVLRTLTGRDPYKMPGFATFALVVELAQTDPRVQATVERLFPLD